MKLILATGDLTGTPKTLNTKRLKRYLVARNKPSLDTCHHWIQVTRQASALLFALVVGQVTLEAVMKSIPKHARVVQTKSHEYDRYPPPFSISILSIFVYLLVFLHTSHLFLLEYNASDFVFLPQ